MSNTNQIRLILEEIFAIADCGHEPDEDHGLARIEKLAIEALDLLPCKTCNGTREITPPSCNLNCINCEDKRPCPDCQPCKTCNGRRQIPTPRSAGFGSDNQIMDNCPDCRRG